MILKRHVTARILLIGDSGVGKSVYRQRIHAMASYDDIDVPGATIYVDYAIIDRKRQDRHVRVQLADAAGSMHFAQPLPNFFRRVEVVLIMYDIGNYASFAHVRERWYPWVRDHCSRIILLANKCDLPLFSWHVPHEEGRKLAAEIGAQGLYELSGRDDDLEKLCIPFDVAVDQILALHPPSEDDIYIAPAATPTKACCASSSA